MCEDPKPAVRAAMCQQLSAVYPYLNLNDDLIRNLNTLSKDGDSFVRASAVSSIGQCFKLPNMKRNLTQFLPIIKLAVKKAFVTGDLAVLEEFTKFVGDMAKVFSGEEQ